MERRVFVASVCAWLAVTATALAQPPPNIEVTPTSLSFGSVCLQATSAARTITIRNDAGMGAQSLNVTARKVGPNPGDFPTAPALVPPDNTFSIAPQGSATIGVSFKPAQLGLRSATVQLDHDDPNEATPINVSLSGRGVDREIATNASTISFGDQRVGTRSPAQSLLIRNLGQDALRVSEVKKAGTHAADFIVTSPKAPFTIPAGDYRTVTVAFQPKASGLRKASLEISSDACNKPKLTVSLVGTGAVSAIVVEPNPIDVGASPLGAQGPPTTVGVSNRGGAPLKITAVQIVGADAADFALSGLPTMPTTVQPDDTFVFSVRLTPQAEGPRIAGIRFLSDDPDNATLTIPLRGAGGAPTPSPTPSPTPTISPTPTSSPTPSPGPQARAPVANDSFAVGVVVGLVVATFGGLLVIRHFVAESEDD